MANREVTLMNKLRVVQNIEANPNEGSRLQRQINLLAEEITRLKNPRAKKARGA
ncbi:hypothetical protein LCGC14_1722090 [marine sediment metagenome]|uniref:Uncharacterized protein n=1 Tax=marine sediment metagenome TaxID=412755 RepID=A0A0F9HC67_9ZZZZ